MKKTHILLLLSVVTIPMIGMDDVEDSHRDESLSQSQFFLPSQHIKFFPAEFENKNDILYKKLANNQEGLWRLIEARWDGEQPEVGDVAAAASRLLKFARPQISITGTCKSIKNVDKYQGKELTTCLHEVMDLPDGGLVKKIEAYFEAIAGGFGIITWERKDTDNAYQSFDKIYPLQSLNKEHAGPEEEKKVKGTSLKIDATGLKVYIGCSDGSVRIFDVSKKRFINTLVHEDKKPVVALTTLWSGKGLITMEPDKVTYVWSVDDAFPRVVLAGKGDDFSKNYVFAEEGIVVRSHADKSRLKIPLFDGDIIYELPLNYLQNAVAQINPVQSAFLFKLYQIWQMTPHDLREEPQKEALTRLYNSFARTSFEHTVRNSLTNFLREKAAIAGVEFPKSLLE